MILLCSLSDKEMHPLSIVFSALQFFSLVLVPAQTDPLKSPLLFFPYCGRRVQADLSVCIKNRHSKGFKRLPWQNRKKQRITSGRDWQLSENCAQPAAPICSSQHYAQVAVAAEQGAKSNVWVIWMWAMGSSGWCTVTQETEVPVEWGAERRSYLVDSQKSCMWSDGSSATLSKGPWNPACISDNSTFLAAVLGPWSMCSGVTGLIMPLYTANRDELRRSSMYDIVMSNWLGNRNWII